MRNELDDLRFRRMLLLMIPLMSVFGCSNATLPRTIVNSKIQQASFVELKTGRALESSAPDQIIDILKTMIPCDEIGDGKVVKPDYRFKLFVAGEWATIEAKLTGSDVTFSLDGHSYQSSNAQGFRDQVDQLFSFEQK